LIWKEVYQRVSGRLDGKVALVTGASRGIGRATAQLLAREGAAVIVNFAERTEAAEAVVEDIRQSGGQAIAVRANVAYRREVLAMVEQGLRQFSRLDVLVNNAGIFRSGTVQNLTDASIDEAIAVNLKGMIHCIQAVIPEMIGRRYGKIINLSSTAGMGSTALNTTPYAVTKAAIIGLTKRVALDLRSYGINVNAICPGFIRTDMIGSALPAQVSEATVSRTLLGRLGEPDDIAAAVLFFGSDEATFITAQVLTMDGGRTDFLSHSG
jgi:3-oxoacyl-[acyl-carrier protein] reductase